MKTIFSLLLLFAIQIVCYAAEPVEIPGFKTIFEKYDSYGSILIYDRSNNSYMGYNLARCNEPFSPASTFKIANSLIAFETGVVTPDTIFSWKGEKMRLPAWEADMNIEQAFRVSSVPVYQEIARRIRVERMQWFLRLFNYGEMDVHPGNIDKFWLEGESHITQFQQVSFLQQLYDLKLPVSKKAMQQTKQLMKYECTDRYVLSGKTGWAVRQQKDVTWFVGFLETNDNVYIFATNVEPTATTNLENFSQTRIELTKDVFIELGLMR